MDKEKLRKILEEIARGAIPVEEALQLLKDLPFAGIDEEVKLDTHRSLRRGYPEVIFGQGKSPRQILKIVDKLTEGENNVMITRVSEDIFRAVEKRYPAAQYNEAGRTVTVRLKPAGSKTGDVTVITGGTTDIPVAEEAAATLEIMDCGVRRLYDAGIAGIHRLLFHRKEILKAEVIIVAAGMEGALPGVVGGMVEVPVIGVPTSVGYGASFGGVSALLTMLNTCASGVTVVNIDNGFGAGYAAALMLKSGVRREER